MFAQNEVQVLTQANNQQVVYVNDDEAVERQQAEHMRLQAEFHNRQQQRAADLYEAMIQMGAGDEQARAAAGQLLPQDPTPDQVHAQVRSMCAASGLLGDDINMEEELAWAAEAVQFPEVAFPDSEQF